MPESLAFDGIALHPGAGGGELVVLDAPLSFWGGTEGATGRITDEHHPQCGVDLAGQVVAMRSGRGSSSSASVLAEAVRAGTAPAALLLAEADAVIVLGALVAAELYGQRLPVVLLDPASYAALSRGVAEVEAGDERAIVRITGAAPTGTP